MPEMIKAQKVKLARREIADGFPEKDVLKKYGLKASELIKKEKPVTGFKVEKIKAQTSPAQGAQTSPAQGAQSSPDQGAQTSLAQGAQSSPDQGAQSSPVIDPNLSKLFADETEKKKTESESGDLLDESNIEALELLLADKEFIGQLLDFYVADFLKSDKPLTPTQKKLFCILVPRIVEKRFKDKSFKYMDEIILIVALAGITLPRVDWKKINLKVK
jgi:hypothetical protein